MGVQSGISYPNNAGLEAIGFVDRLRVYGTAQGINNMPGGLAAVGKNLLSLTTKGQDLDVSCNYKDANGYILATDIWPGKKYDNVWQTYAAAMAALPFGSRFTVRHEEDGKDASHSGSYSQLNDAFKYIAELCYATPDFAAVCDLITCWTGFQILVRAPQLMASLQVSEGLAIDQPYLDPGAPWQTFDQMMGPTFDYINGHLQEFPVYIWEFGVDPRSGRSAWFADAGNTIKNNPRYKKLLTMDYWNVGNYTLDQAGLNALAAMYKEIA